MPAKEQGEYERFLQRKKAADIEAKAEAERREVRQAYQRLSEAQQELNRWTSQERLQRHYEGKASATVLMHKKQAEADIKKYQRIIDKSGGSKHAGFRA